MITEVMQSFGIAVLQSCGLAVMQVIPDGKTYLQQDNNTAILND
jgi:hypothetical protein